MGGQYLFFQGDGNLVLAKNADGTGVVWASNIYSSCAGASSAVFYLQPDGNFVMAYPLDATYEAILGDTGSSGETVSTHWAVIK